MITVQDCSDSECDAEEGTAILPSELPTVVIAAHNGILGGICLRYWVPYFIGSINMYFLTTTSALRCKAPANVIKYPLRIRFDFAMLLFETLRHGMSWGPLEQWLFVDTLAIVQAVGIANLGGCAKLQCLARGHCVGLQAHRALDDCIALRAVVQGVAESYGVRLLDFLRDMVVRLDASASAAQVATL